MALSTEAWKLEVLNAEQGTYSLRCVDQEVFDSIYSGPENWPSDAEVSALIGKPVKLRGAGDDLAEAIYEEIREGTE